MKMGDGADPFGLVLEGHTPLDLSCLQLIKRLEVPIGDAFVGQRPEPFTGLEFRRIRRQEEELNALWDDHFSAGVPARLIQNEQ